MSPSFPFNLHDQKLARRKLNVIIELIRAYIKESNS